MLAAKNGDLRRVKALIRKGADVNAQEEGYCCKTALMYAAEKGSADCVKALIAAGADVNAEDHIGRTALMQNEYKSDIAAILQAASSKGWYLVTAHHNRVRQIVLTLPPTCVRESKFQGLMLMPHYRVTQKDWTTEVFTLDADPGPYLIVRADNVTAKLRGNVTRMAFGFCHMKSIGVFSIFVNVDRPPATCREIGFANIGFGVAVGLDTERALTLMGNFIRRTTTQYRFAERNEDAGEYINGATGTRMTGFPQGRFDLVSDVPLDCLAAIEREWNSLIAYHKTLSRPDFQRGVDELWKLIPEVQDKCPILAPPRAAHA